MKMNGNEKLSAMANRGMRTDEMNRHRMRWNRRIEE